MKIKLIVTNHLGVYNSEVMEVTEEQYFNLVELSKSFWITDTSFSIWTDNGSAVIFPPDIARQSILSIEVL